MSIIDGVETAKFNIGKDIEKEMITILKKNSKGLLLVAEYQGRSIFIMNNEIKNQEKFLYELRLLIKSYI